MSNSMYSPTYEVVVRDHPGSWNVNVYLLNYGRDRYIGRIVENILEWVEIKDGDEPEPTFVINADVWKSIEHHFTADHERDKHMVEAELNATKYHLEDMRKLALKEAQ